MNSAMTELEALNLILLHMGEGPMNSLDEDAFTEATLARMYLDNTSRAIQSKGLACNSERAYPLVRNSDGRIVLPNNTLKVDRYYQDNNIVQRGLKLYDKENHTDIFERDVKVDITFMLAFEDLPQAARTYIAVKAARIAQALSVGSDTLNGLTQREEDEARAAFFSEEMRADESTIFDTPDMQAMVNRRASGPY